jgi:hypothetical protein
MKSYKAKCFEKGNEAIEDSPSLWRSSGLRLIHNHARAQLAVLVLDWEPASRVRAPAVA